MSKHSYSFKPYLMPGRTTYAVKFFHPIQHRQVTRGIGTTNPKVADKIANDVRLLCEKPDRPQNDLNPIAVGAFFGRDSAEYHQLRYLTSLANQVEAASQEHRLLLTMLDEIESLTREHNIALAVKARCNAVKLFIHKCLLNETRDIEIDPRVIARIKRKKKKRARRR